ncbi:large terminase protein, partial [Escherichia coli MA6]
LCMNARKSMGCSGCSPLKGHPSTESRWPACHVSETKTGFTLPKSVRIPRKSRFITASH